MTSASPNKFEWFPHRQLLNEFLSLGPSNPKKISKVFQVSHLFTPKWVKLKSQESKC